jgi:hypothetical protein
MTRISLISSLRNFCGKIEHEMSRLFCMYSSCRHYNVDGVESFPRERMYKELGGSMKDYTI